MNSYKKLTQLTILLGSFGLVFNFISPSTEIALADNGAIWTTNGNCGTPQNVNQYAIGDNIFINGSGFDAGNYTWTITGQPGNASADPNIDVASGIQTVNAPGTFCFNAY